MLVTGIKSRPVYDTLAPDVSGSYHLLVGQGSGGAALLRLLKAMPKETFIDLIYARQSFSGRDYSDGLLSFGIGAVGVYATQNEVITELDRRLGVCVMGTRVYIAGSESFIGSCVQVAARYNLNSDEVQREHCGTSARRVYCLHCKTPNEDVLTNVVRCRGCGRHLLVRDHYSRRLAAYMGVMVDAEAPGEVPPIEEVFS